MYVDGFNLYFGLKSGGWKKYYWLDLVRLSGRLLIKGQQLEGTHYFTSRLGDVTNRPSLHRQTTFLEALGTLEGLTIHYGHYLVINIQPPLSPAQA